MNDDLSDEERSEQVRGVLLKALAVVVVIGVLIAIGTTIMVRALGLDDGGANSPVGAVPKPHKPLPSTALPGSGDSSSPSSSPTQEPSDAASPGTGKRGDLELSISPVRARPMQRVNLTGTYHGADNVQLEVQRFANGGWSDFGVRANVHLGTFATYIQTGQSGENRFRVFDPQAHQGSNVILVTIG